MQELDSVVPVFISEKLQNQIHYMCKQVWNDEWSGMLFYETEGEFGTEGFKILAQELFPLDIGSATYTEYQTSDPELIKFMMSNTAARGMKKGHIHSHNNMGVFFSGTDNDELGENCPFHNFYLSLIVNNKNEMCAKIAFKAKIKSETTSTLTFKNQNGKDIDKVLNGSKESESIFVYKCKIEAPQGGSVEDTFKSRFQELRTIKIKKEEEKKKTSDAAKSTHGKSYEQKGLFDDDFRPGGYSKGKEDYMERSSVVGRDVKPTDRRVYSMLGKILAQDYLYEGTIGLCLEKLDKKFYDFDGVYPSEAVAANMYFDAVEKNAIDYYIDSFPEDRNLLQFDSTMEKCVEILDNYDEQFPELITHLTEALNLEIR